MNIYRVMRGGSWYVVAQVLRSAYRDYGSPGDRGYDVGFRLVRTKVSLGCFTLEPLGKKESVKQAIAKVQTALDELKELLK